MLFCKESQDFFLLFLIFNNGGLTVSGEGPHMAVAALNVLPGVDEQADFRVFYDICMFQAASSGHHVERISFFTGKVQHQGTVGQIVFGCGENTETVFSNHLDAVIHGHKITSFNFIYYTISRRIRNEYQEEK